jgi:tripartite-type tricarboxylate transporter receptor subunit TctC
LLSGCKITHESLPWLKFGRLYFYTGCDFLQVKRFLETYMTRFSRTSFCPDMNRRQLILAAGAAAPLVSLPSSVQAQAAFPNRPITLVCPWPAGGSTDRHLRALAEIASKHLGQQVVVQNQPGAGGTLGPANVANARPDGYTITQFPLGMMRIPHMQKVAWDPVRDFTMIIGLTGYTFGVVVKADAPYRSFKEYIDAGKAAPGKISYASTGTGTSPHLLMEMVTDAAGVDLVHVPFKGNADSTQALLGGHVNAQSDATGWARFVDGGQMRLLVTFGERRTKRWPQVPTAKELGYNVVSTSPYGLAGPKGMDPAVVKVLHDAFRKAAEDPEHIKVLDQLDQEPWLRSSEEYTRWVRDTFTAEKALIDRLGLGPK